MADCACLSRVPWSSSDSESYDSLLESSEENLLNPGSLPKISAKRGFAQGRNEGIQKKEIEKESIQNRWTNLEDREIERSKTLLSQTANNGEFYEMMNSERTEISEHFEVNSYSTEDFNKPTAELNQTSSAKISLTFSEFVKKISNSSPNAALLKYKQQSLNVKSLNLSENSNGICVWSQLPKTINNNKKSTLRSSELCLRRSCSLNSLQDAQRVHKSFTIILKTSISLSNLNEEIPPSTNVMRKSILKSPNCDRNSKNPKRVSFKKEVFILNSNSEPKKKNKGVCISFVIGALTFIVVSIIIFV